MLLPMLSRDEEGRFDLEEEGRATVGEHCRSDEWEDRLEWKGTFSLSASMGLGAEPFWKD